MKSPLHYLNAAVKPQFPSLTKGILRPAPFNSSAAGIKIKRKQALRAYQIGALGVLSSVAGVVLGASAAQAAPVTLQFSGATCETNTGSTCLAQGSVWRFSNVVVSGSGPTQRDALITISALVNGATLATIDDTVNGTGPRFQPNVVSPNNANATAYAKFNIKFVAPGTTTTAAVGGEVYETAFDVDGDGQAGTTGIRELVEFGTPVSSKLDNPTLLATNSPVLIAGGASYIVGQSANNQAGIGISNQYKVTALYDATTTNFDLILGSKTGSAACGGACSRLSSISFDITEAVPLNDVLVTKTHTGNFTQGETGATYSLTVTNYGALATSGLVTVIDTLPTGLTATAASGTGWTCSLNTPAAGQVQCTRSDALAFSSSYPPITLTVNVSGTAASSVTNSATVSGGGDYYTGNNTATDPTTIIGASDLTLSKSHSGSFNVGSTGTYNFSVGNAGGSSTAGTISFTDTLPTGLTVNGGAAGSVTLGGTNAANWTCSSNAASPQVITCTSTSAIAASGTSAFNFPINVGLGTAVGNNSITNSASVSGGGEVNTANDSATDPTTILSPDLTITKSHSGNFTQGSSGAYSLTVANGGTTATSGTVTVVDTLPTGLSVPAGSVTLNGANAANWSCSASGQTITCTSTTGIAISGSSTFGFNVNVASNAPASLTNSVTVSGGNEATAKNGNNAATDPTTVIAPANVLLVKRITAINGDRTKNPNDNTVLNVFVDDTTSIYQADDNNTGWPSNYLLGVIDAGKVKPGDDIEYTVYFLNAGGSTADTVKICDLVAGAQDFKPDAYGTNQDIELKIGKTTNTSTFLTRANDVGDRAQVITSSGTVPSSCNLKGANTNSTVVLDVTGTTGAPTLTTLPNTTGTGAPDDSFGFFRFTTKVKP